MMFVCVHMTDYESVKWRISTMNIHEYQGKAVLKQYGVVVPKGKLPFPLMKLLKQPKS